MPRPRQEKRPPRSLTVNPQSEIAPSLFPGDLLTRSDYSKIRFSNDETAYLDDLLDWDDFARLTDEVLGDPSRIEEFSLLIPLLSMLQEQPEEAKAFLHIIRETIRAEMPVSESARASYAEVQPLLNDLLVAVSDPSAREQLLGALTRDNGALMTALLHGWSIQHVKDRLPTLDAMWFSGLALRGVLPIGRHALSAALDDLKPSPHLVTQRLQVMACAVDGFAGDELAALVLVANEEDTSCTAFFLADMVTAGPERYAQLIGKVRFLTAGGALTSALKSFQEQMRRMGRTLAGMRVGPGRPIGSGALTMTEVRQKIRAFLGTTPRNRFGRYTLLEFLEYADIKEGRWEAFTKTHGVTWTQLLVQERQSAPD